jgi:hypothetical protein
MNARTLTLLLQLAGVLHLGLIWAGASMPAVVNLRGHLAVLPSFIRRLFYVYYSFIGLLLVGFGCLTFFFASDLAAGSALARAVCLILVGFWTLRLIAAAFIFDVRPYLTSWFYRAGYRAINLVFAYLLVVYVLAAWKGGSL